MSGSIGMLASILIIGTVAIANIFTRAFPFVLFGRKKKTPLVVIYLGKYLPPVIIATLVIYCLKDVKIMTGSHGLPELICIAVVAGLHLWKKNILISIGIGTILYMLLIQTVFI
jgi:branched-subunit amino acid transport protein AzlD